MAETRVELPGSHRDPLAGRETLGPADPSETAHVTVVLRRKEQVLPITPYGAPKRRDEYTAAHGADPLDIEAVRSFAKEYRLETRNDNAATRTIELKGKISDLCLAFGVSLEKARIKDTTFLHRTGCITLPEGLIPQIEAVLGLDTRPAARPHRVKVDSSNPSAVASAFSPLEVTRLYNFPTKFNGSEQTIAIIELDGGFVQSDVNAYFRGLSLQPPKISTVLIDGQTNQIDRHLPQYPELNADDEVALDIEIAGVAASGAKQVVFFAQNTDQSFLKAINAAIFATPQPTAISISWGRAENSFSKQAMRAFECAFQDAANLGIPVCVSAGDSGSFDATGSLQVDFPASAPHALGCGGTSLRGSDDMIASETVWNAVVTDHQGNRARKGAGGGVSQFFAKPVYQSNVDVPPPPKGLNGGRGVPDVCGSADPATGYRVRVKGVNEVIGGTGAVAPLWAGLIARLGQAIGGPVGFLHPQIYKARIRAAGFRNITEGDNDSQGKGGLYHANPGWNPCTGVGSPDGAALLTALGAPPLPKLTPKPKSLAPKKSKPNPRPAPHPTPKPVPFPELKHNPPHEPKPAQFPLMKPALTVPQTTCEPSPHPVQASAQAGKPEAIRSAPPSTSQVSAPSPSSKREQRPALAAKSQTALAKEGTGSVALACVMGLAAAAGMVSAVGIVAAIALTQERK